MRESLGVVFENQSISTALVDADTPLLGSIDEFRHPWGADGTVPSPQASARALASAAEVATGRALRSNLCPTVVGVMCERADVREHVSDSLSSSPFENIELVNGLDARLAYLRTVDALIGVSPILAFWPDGSETVIAAVDPRAGVVDSAHRYDTAELLADSSTFAATLDLLVAERDPVPKMLVAMLVKEDSRRPSAEAAELAGLGFLFLGERTQLAIGAALVAADRGSEVRSGGGMAARPVNRVRWAAAIVLPLLLMLTGLLIALSPDGSRAVSTDSPNIGAESATSTSGPPPGAALQIPTLAPCDPVVPAVPAVLRRSDPEVAPLQTDEPTAEECTPLRVG
ncbi:hypothetical protein ACQGAO_01270 [Rhodococcus sp. 1.20]|uniref:hypothetical protein n=1 Tax=Rhodococcus TaxID=1827 RepID=UPI000A51345A|nr:MULTISPECIES: hypothetical protein [Rhodococcus]MCC4302662.1 hypothetical protein [Rhodococcus sp. 3-2]MDI9944074.1 hypothetical protein [Rhodococcus sp. IEGM 1302]MEA1795165.1 hypothetical protein [Rhodococcus qingshengii]WOI89827.1 hypothetical protein R0122_14020 [Rhodococcus qingshengii]